MASPRPPALSEGASGRGPAVPGHTQGACTQAETARGAPTAAKGFPLLGADWWGVRGAVSSHVCLRAGVPAASAKPCCALSQSKVRLRSGCRQGPGGEGPPSARAVCGASSCRGWSAERGPQPEDTRVTRGHHLPSGE